MRIYIHKRQVNKEEKKSSSLKDHFEKEKRQLEREGGDQIACHVIMISLIKL